MPLPPGARLGPYEIVSAIGAGGMGEVYKARDTRLGRIVAIKVLPEGMTADRRRRFEQEARAASALNHPQICALHDIGSTSSPHAAGQATVYYLVMEHLEGRTLAARLATGPLPLAEVLELGAQIADALAAAHRAGIVHRDLKPANIMLTKSGAKLLDFGVAKLRPQPSAPGAGAWELSTLEPATSPGVVMGTVPYMAPEQLEGKDTDPRTDVFAFGCVLYEMLTGRRAFQGDTEASLISAIMTSEPPAPSTLQPLTPRALARLVKGCLAKDPDARRQSAWDVACELRGLREDGPILPGVQRTSRAVRAGSWLGWGAAAVVALAALVAWRSSGTPPPIRVQFTIPVPAGSVVRSVAVSPDGQRIAYVLLSDDGRSRLWLRPLDGPSRPLARAEDANYPFWSPDGGWIAFFAQGKLWKQEVSGGTVAVPICDAPIPRGGTWNRDGVILFAPGTNGPLHRVSASGGPSVPLTTVQSAEGEDNHRFPSFMPNGREFVYHAGHGREKLGATMLRSLGSDVATVVHAGSSPAIAAPGHLLFETESAIFAQEYDEESRSFRGEPVRLGSGFGVRVSPSGSRVGAEPRFSVSPSGVLAYPTGGDSTSELVWLDRIGSRLLTAQPAGQYSMPRISPDNLRVAYVKRDPDTERWDVWVLDRAAGQPSRLASNGVNPVWESADSVLLMRSMSQWFQRPISGVEPESPVVDIGINATQRPLDTSSDGRYVLFSSWDPKELVQKLCALPMTGDRRPVRLVQAVGEQSDGRLSPDGRWVAFTQKEPGGTEVFIQEFPVPHGRWRVSPAGGSRPRWRRDNGQELYFLASDGSVMAVPVTTGATWNAEPAKRLFAFPGWRKELADELDFDPTPDGRQFIVTLPHSTEPDSITVVLDWKTLLPGANGRSSTNR